MADALEHLLGLQAQVPWNPYVGLWSRLDLFDPEELGRMVSEREAVRIALMRATVHLVSARDCLAFRPLIQPAMSKALFSSPFGKAIAGVDNDALLLEGRRLLEERPMGIKELGKLLQDRWPDRDAQSLAYAVHYQLPLVQLPPRGVWGKAGRPVCTTAEAWLAQPLEPRPDIEELVLRYLRAFGPATPADCAAWSGLTGLTAVFEGLRPQLRSYRDEKGRELFDPADLELPDPELPAPPRFLPEYDNVFLGHADRSRIVSEEDRKTRLPSAAGSSSLLIDGFIKGSWRLTRSGKTALLSVQPIETLPAKTRTALEVEAEGLLVFLARGSELRDLRVLDPP